MKPLTDIIQRKTVVFCFGRMNPPSVGHERVLNYVLESARRAKATPAIFISQSTDSVKNPLTVEQKLRYINLSFPQIKPYLKVEESIKTPIDALNSLIQEGYNNFIFVVGEDRLESFSSTFSTYIKSKPQGSLVETFSIVSVGQRFESPSIEGVSSSKMRNFVKTNSYEHFKQIAPTHLSDKFCLQMFTDIQQTMYPNTPVVFESATPPAVDINIHMNTFKTFLVEAEGKQAPSNLATAIHRQKREIDDQEKRHTSELEKARETDFKDREDKKRKKDQDRDNKNTAKHTKMHKDRELRFRKREADRRTRQAQKSAEKEIKRRMSSEETIFGEYDIVVEYLEDGTLELVTTYKKQTPGQ